MKVSQYYPRRIRPAAVSLLSVALIGLLPWRLVAQAPKPQAGHSQRTVTARHPSAGEPKDASSHALTQPSLATVSAGQFKIAVNNVRRVNATNVKFVPSGFAARDNLLLQNAKEERTSFSNSRDSDGANGGGSGGSAAGGFAASGSGQSFGHVNVMADLLVSKAGRNRNQLLCTVVGKVRAKDDLGNMIDSPDLAAHQKLEVQDVAYPQGSGCTTVHLNLKNNEAKSIRSLAGNLLVSDARIQVTAFEGNELNKVSIHRLEGITVSLDQLKSSENGIDMIVSVTMPDPFGDARNFHNMGNRLKVLLEDNQGKTHEAISSSGGGSGGGSSGNRSFKPSGSGKMPRHPGGQGQSLPPASYNLHFAPLTEDVAIKRIKCTVTELLGKPQVIAFEFSDLPIP